MNDYDKQAEEFLKGNGLRMTITKVPYTPQLWEDAETLGCRNKYSVCIRRKLIEACQGDNPARRLVFDFWGSNHDFTKGEDPSQYDVLACIGSDVICPDTFEEFCSNYGYDEDSRKAEKIFKAANALTGKLRLFFSDEEITELQEIR